MEWRIYLERTIGGADAHGEAERAAKDVSVAVGTAIAGGAIAAAINGDVDPVYTGATASSAVLAAPLPRITIQPTLA